MKIKPNYLYRVLGELEKDGRVRKERPRLPPGLRAPSPPTLDQAEVGDGVALVAQLGDEASIRSREKSVISRPSTIEYSPPAHGTG